MLALIVAMDRFRAIGRNNALPWHLPADLARFRRLTTGHTVIMGRKTFESIGKPLPKRSNWVLTRDANWQAEGVRAFFDLQELFGAIRASPETLFWGIGGAQIYERLLPHASRLEVTTIDIHVADADTFFPAIPGEFELRQQESKNDAGLAFEFQSYCKAEAIP